MKRVVVIGGGISGLAAAWRLQKRNAELEITIVEALSRFGGKLISEQREGFVVEGAADGFLARKPPALQWVRELGFGAELIEPQPEHRRSQVLWDGQLHAMPEGFSGLVPTNPAALRNTTLLTTQGIDRLAAEPSIPLRADTAEESVREFFVRRFGPEAFERLMEPLLVGIFAGDADKLSAEAAFPQLVALERGGRSLIHGLSEARPEPGPAFRSFAGGMATYPQALESALRSLRVNLVCGQSVTSVSQSGGRFTVHSSATAFPADAVIMALPPRQAGNLLSKLSPDLATVLQQWPVSSVANLNLAFDQSELPGLPVGSGFVAPRGGQTLISAATWSSQKWPLRAPGDRVLVRLYFGGARDTTAWKLPEADLVEAALDTLSRFGSGQRPKPLWHRLFRWQDAFAQPNLGHAQRQRALAKQAIPGIVLAGGYFAGPGIPDCLARSEFAAGETARYLDMKD